jgi:hypothetical protein
MDYVRVLWEGGIDTYESCEGGPGHSYPGPAVRFHGTRSEGFAALHVAVQHGLPVRTLSRFWDLDKTGEPSGPHWEMTFWPRRSGTRTESSEADSRFRRRDALA